MSIDYDKFITLPLHEINTRIKIKIKDIENEKKRKKLEELKRKNSGKKNTNSNANVSDKIPYDLSDKEFEKFFESER